MTQQSRYEAFMQRIMNRPLPDNPMARLRVLAKELAEGMSQRVWNSNQLMLNPSEEIDPETKQRRVLYIPHRDFTDYFSRRWGDDYPPLNLLRQNEYVDQFYRLTKSAFDLIQEVESAEIFISYRRKESSAFALLVLARLKDFDLNAFLDMSIRPGDNWHAYIKEQIQQRDYFILLLGKETLNSDVVKQEIQWAIEVSAEIIPIWHNGFEYQEGEFDLPPEIQKVLHSNHSIRVLEESALAYDSAITELLNRFGVTP